jgi:hypothetical protein
MIDRRLTFSCMYYAFLGVTFCHSSFHFFTLLCAFPNHTSYRMCVRVFVRLRLSDEESSLSKLLTSCIAEVH